MKTDSILLIANATEDDYNVEQWKQKVDFLNILKPRGRVLRFFRKKIIRFKIGKRIWYKKINFEYAKYDLVVIFASELLLGVPEYIRTVNKKCKIVLWYWNPIDKRTMPRKTNKESAELWTFNEADAKKYGLKFNTQFYYDNIKLPKREIENDIFFIGIDKGRAPKIVSLVEEWREKGVQTDIKIVFDKTSDHKYNQYKSEAYSYDKVLESIAKSKSILDYNQNNQTGITLRPLEALFFNKKLITNNPNIKKYNFYNTNNIYIIGEDDRDIIDFINIPYEKIDDDIKKQYTFSSWLSGFSSESGVKK